MLTLELAVALRDAGLQWAPAPGDRFVVLDHDLDDQVFVLSDMVVQSVDAPHGPPLLAFNGTTEWALDSVQADEAVWLPREEQLRVLLGDSFVSLERVDADPEGWAVTVRSGGGTTRHVDVDAESAYARAVLAASA